MTNKQTLLLSSSLTSCAGAVIAHNNYPLGLLILAISLGLQLMILLGIGLKAFLKRPE